MFFAVFLHTSTLVSKQPPQRY